MFTLDSVVVFVLVCVCVHMDVCVMRVSVCMSQCRVHNWEEGAVLRDGGGGGGGGGGVLRDRHTLM